MAQIGRRSSADAPNSSRTGRRVDFNRTHASRPSAASSPRIPPHAPEMTRHRNAGQQNAGADGDPAGRRVRLLRRERAQQREADREIGEPPDDVDNGRGFPDPVRRRGQTLEPFDSMRTRQYSSASTLPKGAAVAQSSSRPGMSNPGSTTIGALRLGRPASWRTSSPRPPPPPTISGMPDMRPPKCEGLQQRDGPPKPGTAAVAPSRSLGRVTPTDWNWPWDEPRSASPRLPTAPTQHPIQWARQLGHHAQPGS